MVIISGSDFIIAGGKKYKTTPPLTATARKYRCRFVMSAMENTTIEMSVFSWNLWEIREWGARGAD